MFMRSGVATLGVPRVPRSSEDQEVLFDQILTGQLDFPLPYWDNVSDTAKVSPGRTPVLPES